ARLSAGESLATRFEASGEIYYVIAGSGETTWGSEAIGWDAGDVFCLPRRRHGHSPGQYARRRAVDRHQRARARVRARAGAPARTGSRGSRPLSGWGDSPPARADPSPARRQDDDGESGDAVERRAGQPAHVA